MNALTLYKNVDLRVVMTEAEDFWTVLILYDFSDFVPDDCAVRFSTCCNETCKKTSSGQGNSHSPVCNIGYDS